jgi:hypothetical protein
MAATTCLGTQNLPAHDGGRQVTVLCDTTVTLAADAGARDRPPSPAATDHAPVCSPRPAHRIAARRTTPQDVLPAHRAERLQPATERTGPGSGIVSGARAHDAWRPPRKPVRTHALPARTCPLAPHDSCARVRPNVEVQWGEDARGCAASTSQRHEGSPPQHKAIRTFLLWDGR